MIYSVAILSGIGASLYFGAWSSSSFTNELYMIGFFAFLFITIISTSLANLKDTVKKQTEEIRQLRRALSSTPPPDLQTPKNDEK